MTDDDTNATLKLTGAELQACNVLRECNVFDESSYHMHLAAQT